MAGLITYGINELANNHVRTTEYTYTNEKIPAAFNGYKIMVISDLHNAPFAEQILDIAKDEKPDVAVFTGDMVQLPDDWTNVAVQIGKALGEEIPLYAVTGNHETQNYSSELIMSELGEGGIASLDNSSVLIERDGEEILLAGLRDPKSDYLTAAQYENARNTALSLARDGVFGILLNHRADMYPEIKDSWAGLIISGHLHGGIIRLPFIGGIMGEGFAPEYTYGFYSGGSGADMIVSGGCDLNPKKKRVFNPPEVLIITLRND